MLVIAFLFKRRNIKDSVKLWQRMVPITQWDSVMAVIIMTLQNPLKRRSISLQNKEVRGKNKKG